jgi:RimJ/RimL family protein N-acetyltransferase
MRFMFKRVVKEQKPLIEQWLSQPYIQEWIHGEGLQNTLDYLEQSFREDSLFQHWIAYDVEVPFGYLLTSSIIKDPQDEYFPYCNPEGKAITLDVFICDPSYLGKGLSQRMIKEFLLSQFPHVQEVLIDPEAKNTRAVHVYEKVGFKIVGERIPKWHPVPHLMMHLDVNELKKEAVKDSLL